MLSCCFRFLCCLRGGDLRLTSGGASGLVVAEALDPKVVLHVLILGVETLSAGCQLGQLRVLQGCQIVP